MAVNWNLFNPSGTLTQPRNPAVAQAIQPQRSRMQQIGDAIDSPFGKLALSGVGTYLDAQDHKADRNAATASDAADRASRERIAAMGATGDLQGQEMADARARQAGVLDANPLGAEQDYNAKAAFLRNAMGMLNNTSIAPGDPAVAAAMGKVSGGFQITDDMKRAMTDAWSQDRTNQSLAQRRMDTARLDPGRGLASGLGDDALDSRVNDFASQQRTEMDAAAQQRRTALQRALDNNPTGEGQSPEEEFNANFDAIAAAKQQTGDWEKAYQLVTGKPWPKGQHITISGNQGHMEKDGGFWRGLGNVAKVAAPIAASFIPGVGPLASAGIGAATGALNGGLKGAILGGASGFASGRVQGKKAGR